MKILINFLQEKINALRIKNSLQKIRELKKEEPALVWMFVAILLVGVVIQAWNESQNSSSPEKKEKLLTADTYIPAGFVLVPIQLANAESLDALINTSGVVDLFASDLAHPGQTKKVAERVKIMRAPLNPNQFAVLVPDEHSADIVHYEGAFTAVIQNPNKGGTNFLALKQKTKPSRISFQGGEDAKLK